MLIVLHKFASVYKRKIEAEIPLGSFY